MSNDTKPDQPWPGSFCDYCGHFAARHGEDGCRGFPDKPCRCRGMRWDGHRWPRPWLEYPEGTKKK